MGVLDASVARVMAGLAGGCASGTAAASTDLLRWNALSMVGVHLSVFLPPLRAVVSGSRSGDYVVLKGGIF